MRESVLEINKILLVIVQTIEILFTSKGQFFNQHNHNLQHHDAKHFDILEGDVVVGGGDGLQQSCTLV